MAGITLSVAAFPKSIAVLSVLYLALGDPFASTVGIKFGKLGPRFSNGKSLIGTLGGFFICAATTALYFARSVQLSGALALVSLLGGVAGLFDSLFLDSPSRAAKRRGCASSFIVAQLAGPDVCSILCRVT